MCAEQIASLSIYIPENKGGAETMARLKRLADARDRSVNHLVVDAILEYLDARERAEATAGIRRATASEIQEMPAADVRVSDEIHLASADALDVDTADGQPSFEGDGDASGTPRTLMAWERCLRPLLGNVELVGEITLTSDQIRSLLNCLRHTLAPPGLDRRLPVIRHAFPAAFVCGLVFGGLHVYADGAYWTKLLPRVGLVADSNTEQELGRTFEGCLRDLRLRTDFVGQRFVGKILGHAGIPESVVPEVIARLITPAVRDRRLSALSSAELVRELLLSGSCSGLDKTVERFLRYGGGAAEEYVQYLRTVVHHALMRGKPLDVHEHTLSKERLRVGRSRLDARGEEPRIREGEKSEREQVVSLDRVGSSEAQPARRMETPTGQRHHRRRAPTAGSPAALARRPRVVCLDDHGRWAIALQARGEEGARRAHQAGVELRSLGGDLFQLDDLTSDIVLDGDAGRTRCRLPQSADRIMLFRAGRNWEGTALPCRTITYGYYVAVVPTEWARDDTRSGPPPVAPERTTAAGRRAHFFFLEENSPLGVSFQRPGGRIASGGSRGGLRLSGAYVPSPDGLAEGVYLAAFPSAELRAGLRWNDVDVVTARRRDVDAPVVRVAPNTAGADGILHLGKSITESGEYTIDALGADGGILATENARFLSGVLEVEVLHSGPLPGLDGHRPAEVVFRCRDGVVIAPAAGSVATESSSVEFMKTFAIPATPAADVNTWVVEDGDDCSLSIRTAVPRVWWRVREECAVGSGPEPDWTDRVLELRRCDFRATSRLILDICVRRAPAFGVFGVGFGRGNLRWSTTHEGICSVPLRSFADDHRLAAGDSDRVFRLFALSNGHDVDAVVARVPVAYRCLVCQSGVAKSDIAAHIAGHLDELAPELHYEEVRQRAMMDLPAKILICPYCSFYVRVPAGRNPADEMLEHQKHACEGANAGRDVRMLGFRVVTDSAEIRGNVIPNLPHFRRCSLCGLEFSSETGEEIVAHLLGEHGGMLVATD